MSETELESHRRIAAAAFNQTWDLLESKNRSSQEDVQMLNLAHTSRYHWGLVGTSENLAVADWQVSRVYADLRQGELALTFAKACLSTCRKDRLDSIIPTAYEALARAYAATKDRKNAEKNLAQARRKSWRRRPLTRKTGWSTLAR